MESEELKELRQGFVLKRLGVLGGAGVLLGSISANQAMQLQNQSLAPLSNAVNFVVFNLAIMGMQRAMRTKHRQSLEAEPVVAQGLRFDEKRTCRWISRTLIQAERAGTLSAMLGYAGAILLTPYGGMLMAAMPSLGVTN